HLGVAHLDHAAQQAGRVDATQRLVDRAAVAADLAGVALDALVFGDELFAQGDVGVLENRGALCMGRRSQPGGRSAEQQGGAQGQGLPRDRRGCAWHGGASGWQHVGPPVRFGHNG
ncbi:hypothetical protein RZS08_45485, partial [Arthrospira platensis SPKY1]|nr:hypothetical protein [Arthrospira platensis SPKY1]